MKLRLFGKDLFEFHKGGELLTLASQSQKDSKYLPDFSRSVMGNVFENSYSLELTNVAEIVSDEKHGKSKVTPLKPEVKKLTPKNVYELKLLHDETFKINTDPDYVDQQLLDFKDKLDLIKSEEYDMRNGVNEISSIVTRLENRKKYAEFKEFYEAFPYTSTLKINQLTKTHDYLQLGQIAQFVADMPKEAVDIMKAYNKNTEKLCGKQAVFYIVADKKDFKKSDKRRDPILLAQSPFGHFWQILGAWDEEMLLIEEL